MTKQKSTIVRESKRILLLDGNFFAWRAYTTRHLSTSTGIPTSVISGMLQMIKHLYEKFSYDVLIICWDSTQGSEYRKGIFPAYKENRKEIREQNQSIYKQLRLARGFFQRLDVRQAVMRGVEGDDIMGLLSHHYADKGHKVLIATADKDLLQVARPGVTIYRPLTNQLIGPKQFSKLYHGLTPIDLIKVKSLMGDKGDNIPGVPGVGEKRAMEAVIKYRKLVNIVRAANHTSSPKWVGEIALKMKQVKLAYKLARIFTDINDLPTSIKNFEYLIRWLGERRSVEESQMREEIQRFEMKHRNFKALADQLTVKLI